MRYVHQERATNAGCCEGTVNLKELDPAWRSWWYSGPEHNKEESLKVSHESEFNVTKNQFIVIRDRKQELALEKYYVGTKNS